MTLYWFSISVVPVLSKEPSFAGKRRVRFIAFKDETGGEHAVLSDGDDDVLHSKVQNNVLKACPGWEQLGAGYGHPRHGWTFNTTSTSPERPTDRTEAAGLLKRVQDAAVAAGFGKDA